MTEPSANTWRRTAVVLMAAVVAVVFPVAVTPAEAHGNLRSSQPTNGAELQTPPDAVVLRFTEAPEVRLAVIRVLDANGVSFELGSPQPVRGDELAVREAVNQLPDGVYTVAWRVVSRADGHATAGAFAFGVRVSPLNVPPPAVALPKSPPPSGVEITGRWLFILGLVALLGAGVTGRVVFEEPPSQFVPMMWAALVAAVVGLAGLCWAQQAASGASLGAFLATSVGRAALWRSGVLVLVAMVLAVARRRSPLPRWTLLVVALAAAVAMYVEVAAGHAAAARSLRPLEIASQWVHFVAIGVWIGGLAALLLGVRGAPTEPKAVAVRRFSRMAGVTLAVVALTGGVRALDEVGRWGALWSTSYGRVVLLKVGLLLVLITLGALNRYRNVRRAGTALRGLRRVSRAEIAVATVALLASATLAGLAPPRSSASQAAAAPPAGIVLKGTDFAKTTSVRLRVTPGFAGVNRFVATITDFDSGQGVRADRVALRFSFQDVGGIGESSVELKPSAAGEYSATAPNLSLDGRWKVTVLVQRSTTSIELALGLATRCRVRALATEGQPTIYTADLAQGATVQGYVDPGVAGLNEVHFTFFVAAGNELPIEAMPTVTTARGAGQPMTIETRRFSPGHFVSDVQLEPGRRRFQIVVPAAGGNAYRACFEDTVRKR